MNEDALHIFTRETYRRSDFEYRLSLVREFFEYVFFTKRSTQASLSDIDNFVSVTNRSPGEGAFLKTLTESFLQSVTQASFYKTLDDIESDYTKLDAITLTVPVLFSESDVAEIGKWVRKEIAKDVVLEFTVDHAVVAGCRVAWRDRVYDFSFEHYFDNAREDVRARIVERSGVTSL